MEQFTLLHTLDVPVLRAKTYIYRHEPSNCLIILTPFANPLTSLDMVVPFETADDRGYLELRVCP